MASGVHSDKRSRVGDSPRFQWESVSRCCAELYVPRPKTRLRSGLARKHLSVSRQTSRAPVSAPIDGMLSYVHSGCPKLNRSLRGETRAVRSSGEIPGSPRRSCGAPPVPPRARSGEQTPPAAERYHCAYSGLGVAQLVGPNCVRLGEWSVTAPARPCKPQSHPGEGCNTGSPLGFFYLEIWVRAQAPGLTSSVTQPGVVQAAADSRTGQVFQTGLLPQILLQLGQRPGCKSQSQILGMGCRHLQNLAGGSGSVIGRASRAGAIRQPFHSRCQEPAHPTMRIGVVESGRLAGLHQRTAGRQLPDQDRSSVHPSRCGAGTQQALQIHQLLARQFGKSDDVAHTNRVALRTFGLKSNIAILMNKTTSLAAAAGSAEEEEGSSETEEERSIVLGGAFSNLDPVATGLAPGQRGHGRRLAMKGSESIGPGFRSGKVEVGRKRVRTSER